MSIPDVLQQRDARGNDEEIALLRRVTRDSVGSLFGDLPAEAWADSWSASWKALENQGLWSTIEPPDGSLSVAIVVAEELGRALYPGPAYEALAAAAVFSRLAENAWNIDADARPAAAFVCSTEGCVDPIVDVPDQTLLIVASGDEIGTVAAGRAHRTDVPSMDVTRRIVSMRLGESPQPVIGTHAGAIRAGRVVRSVLYCADTLGCMQHVLQKTTEYARQRTTFGSPIGKYQAVAHRLVDHAITVEQARLLISATAAAFDSGAGDLEMRLAITETFLWERARAIISDCIQLCGAIGFTWEWGHHFYLRRVIQNATLGSGFGRPHPRVSGEARVSSQPAHETLVEYREQVRDFISRTTPAGRWYDGIRVPRDTHTEQVVRAWYADLFAAGYLGGSWPERYGGHADHTPYHDAIVMEEIVRARAPRPIDQVMLAAHLIITFGKPAQQDRYLPRIRSAEDIWCQLLSEPGVGSDLARLSTKAEPLPDGTFRVDGQKVWTTDAQWSQMGVLLARTDSQAPRPHAGLTMFVVDMRSPGIDVRPIREMTGSAEFCEVFFDGLILPPDSVLGEVNQGWAVANSGLASERAYVGANAVMLELLFDDLLKLARVIDRPGGVAIDDPVVREELADLQSRVVAVQHIASRAVDLVVSGVDVPADGMIAKLAYTELNVALCQYAMDLACTGRLRDEGQEVYRRWRQAFLWSRALTISGGSSEIIHNVLATQLLGLPRSW